MLVAVAGLGGVGFAHGQGNGSVGAGVDVGKARVATLAGRSAAYGLPSSTAIQPAGQTCEQMPQPLQRSESMVMILRIIESIPLSGI